MLNKQPQWEHFRCPFCQILLTSKSRVRVCILCPGAGANCQGICSFFVQTTQFSSFATKKYDFHASSRILFSSRFTKGQRLSIRFQELGISGSDELTEFRSAFTLNGESKQKLSFVAMYEINWDYVFSQFIRLFQLFWQNGRKIVLFFGRSDLVK